MVVRNEVANLLLYCGKGLSVRNVKDSDATLRIPIVAMCDASEPFLTSSIPHLQLDNLVIYLHCFNFEIHSNGAHIVVSEGVVCKSEQHGSLA